MKIRKHSFPDEASQIGIDFDGVIHKNSLGFYDGTIYDDPIEGSLEAIKKMSEVYEIIIFSAKARKDRMLINGKSGIQLIEEWLQTHGFMEYIKEVTAEKPRAVAYIDDKAFRFTNWKETFNNLESEGIMEK